MTIGQRLKEARLAAGLSQRQLCGDIITRNMLSQIENDAARPSMETLRCLAKRLGKPVVFFLDEEESPDQAALGATRELFRQRNYAEALKTLEEGHAGENGQNEERNLLKALCCLELAEQALTQGRLPYAVSLLEDCATAGENTPYFVPALEQRRLVLLAKAQPEKAEEILAALPLAEEELLLRAQVALHRQEGRLAAAILDSTQNRENSQWCILRGQTAFIQGEYCAAAEYFHRAEQAGDSRADSWLEQCYRQLEDYKMAYHYACKQK